MDDGYDVDAMFDLIRICNSYDEFRVKSDLDELECIITREEFDSFKRFIGRRDDCDEEPI